MGKNIILKHRNLKNSYKEYKYLSKHTPKWYILDTDIGDDVDDALALGYLGKCNDINLIGVTTVLMNTLKRAELACVVLESMSHYDIPVVSGIGKPMAMPNWEFKTRLKKHKPRQMEVLEKVKTKLTPLKIPVMKFLRDKIEKNPGEITLLTIGPLTNIGTFINEYPEISGKIKEIVMMAGCVFATQPEWNALCDPEAASIVFNSGIPIRMIGLDVTLKCTLEEKYIKRIEKSKEPLPALLGKLIRLWQKQVGVNPFIKRLSVPTLHDPLAALVINHPEVIKFEPFRIEIETKGSFTRGITVMRNSGWNLRWMMHPDSSSNALVAVDVNPKKAVEIYMDKILS